MHGEERTMNRIEETRKSVWFKPDLTQSNTLSSKKNSMMYSTYFDIKRETEFNKSLSKNSSTVSNNSKIITEKTRIRDNRQRINCDFINGIEERKKNSVYNFELPKISS